MHLSAHVKRCAATATVIVAGAMLTPADATAEPGPTTVGSPDLAAPAPPPDRVTPVPALQTVGSVIAQATDMGLSNPMAVLGQRPTEPGLASPPPLSLNPLNNSYLLPQNTVPSAPGEGTVVGVEPGQEHLDTTFRGVLSRLWGRYQDGDLEGAMLGRRPLPEPNPLSPVEPVPTPPEGLSAPLDIRPEPTG